MSHKDIFDYSTVMPVRSRERINQKLRTRRDLQEAAAAIVKEKGSVTVAEVAKRAGVSRATAYRFFPRPETLLLEALLAGAMGRIQEFLENPHMPHDPEKRLKVLFDLVADVTEEYEEAWRAYLRYSLNFQNPGEEAVRPGRRLLWIDKALEPVQSLRSPKRYQELRSGLALTLGIEPIIVLRDVCRLEYKQARQVLWSTARTLLRSYLNDAAEHKG
jgi:AcrR family transcriptional regulator